MGISHSGVLQYGRGRRRISRKWVLRIAGFLIMLGVAFAIIMRQARKEFERQQPIIQMVKRVDGRMRIDADPFWRKFLGNEMGKYFDRVRAIDFRNSHGFYLVDLDKVSDLESIEELNVDLCLTGDEEMKSFSKLHNLRILMMENGSVSDRSAALWSSFPKMQILSLKDTHVRDGSVSAIKQMKSLKELYISGTFISKKGVQELREALPQCKIDRAN